LKAHQEKLTALNNTLKGRDNNLVEFSKACTEIPSLWSDYQMVLARFNYCSSVRALQNLLELETDFGLSEDPQLKESIGSLRNQIFADLKNNSKADPLVSMSLASLQKSEGSVSYSQVLNKFNEMKDGAEFDILVSKNTLPNYLWGSSLKFIKLAFIGNIAHCAHTDFAEARFNFIGDLAKLDKVQGLIQQGQLGDAIHLVSQVSDHNSKLEARLAPWMALAKQRLDQERVKKILGTHAETLLSAAVQECGTLGEKIESKLETCFSLA